MADATIDIHRNCPGCNAELALGDRFCAQCGARTDEPHPTASFQGPQPRSRSRPGVSDERFVPGQVLGERFRIVTVIGRGGMGEVYRADDLALGQSVALKFLPVDLCQDDDRLRRLRGEVKTARQVSHPHVCRVYDLGEANEQLFISMEFVDGQNLSALLQQINRLPEERGIEIAQQLCMGLGAIHDRGLLHRDLKPANVMLDGRGQVRITDFGLAAPAEQVLAVEVRDGTPAYQSPEQLGGRDVTARSDIYALGLILYEIFTGKKPFTATERAELAHSDGENQPRRPSSHISGLSPAVEKIILKCLEKEPGERPRTAYEVLAALPGGDPLQAALAAGQTPSPAVVADAKVEGSLHPLTALALLVTALVGIVLVVMLGRPVRLWEQVPHQLSPPYLATRAQELIKQFGYVEAPRDFAYGLEESPEVLKFLSDRDHSAQRWAPLATGQPPAMFFWYRQSQDWMCPLGLMKETDDMASHHGQPTPYNPAFSAPGMVRLCLDLKGRLIEFQALPKNGVPGGPAPALDWPDVLEKAGLVSMEEVADGRPGWAPPQFVDTRLAWRGVYEDSQIPVRADAGLLDGRLVFFQAAPDHKQIGEFGLFSQAPTGFLPQTWTRTLLGLVAITLQGIALVLAWNHVRAGRANIRGTAILGGSFFTAFMLMWVFSAHHVPDYLLERKMLAAELGGAIFWTAHLCVYYLSLEPYVRRRWPWRVVSWNRALAGRWRDPLVGRDLLIGVAVGVVVFGIDLIGDRSPEWLGQSPTQPGARPSVLLTAGPLFGLPYIFASAVRNSLLPVVMLFVLYLFTRREWLAVITYLAFSVMLRFYPGGENRIALLVVAGVVDFCVFVLIMRVGVLALSGVWLSRYMLEFPVTFDTTSWYNGSSLVYLGVLLGVVVYGFVVASGGQALAWVGYLTGEGGEKVEAG